MTGSEVLRLGSDRIRVGPWRSSDRLGMLAPVGVRRHPSVSAVRQAVEELRSRGYRRVVTPALAASEQRPFLDFGFTVDHRLHLLVHPLDRMPSARPIPLRRARRRDHADVLRVDEAAFPAFWRLDADGLADALEATPSNRFRVGQNPATAYAIWGRAADRGYLQRLAVDPSEQGRGLGTALVADGLRWMRRWRVGEVLVNTQTDNARALELYEHLGFRRREPGLAVLGIDLGISG